MKDKQKTINKPVSVSGAGLHTGKEVKLTLRPAPENHGIVFKRIDLEGQPKIEAHVDNVTDTSRGTTLEQNEASVLTIEHALAAITGMGIDNLLIEIDSEETPILDGSSKFYVEAIEKAGIKVQDADKKYLEVKSNIFYSDPVNKVEMLIIPSDEFRLSVMIDYDSEVLLSQHASLDNISDFRNEIACCRTFVFLHELKYLIENNLIKGGDFDNAIVFVDELISQDELDKLALFFNKPKVTVLKEGILNNIDLYFQNEPARHKLLDVIGDLTLLGQPIKGHVIAKRPGHQANVNFAKEILARLKNNNNKSDVPVVDPNKKPLFDVNQIQQLLPHRPPFLLVDKIIEMTKDMVIALKNVTMNETFFVGHFPGEPVMPGVLQVEAMAQSGGILALSSVDNPQDYLTFFLKIDNVKFRHPVVPGDTLIFKLILASPIRRGICHMNGYAYVGNKIVTEAELMAQIVKKKT